MRTHFFALFIVVASFVSPQWVTASDQEIVEYFVCESRSLEVELNVDDQSSKTDLLEALQVIAMYPGLNATLSGGYSAGSVTYTIGVPDSCDNYTCALLAGWNEIQLRLKLVPGTRVNCLELSQSEAVRDGGVIGSN